MYLLNTYIIGSKQLSKLTTALGTKGCFSTADCQDVLSGGVSYCNYERGNTGYCKYCFDVPNGCKSNYSLNENKKGLEQCQQVCENAGMPSKWKG